MGGIVQSLEPITLIGGGEASRAQVSRCLEIGRYLVAADGGANQAIALGFQPDSVIGDLDSISAETLRQIPENAVHRIREQDSTDFDKSLRNIDAPVVLAVGFTGARLDHQLAVMHTLVQNADRPCIVVGVTELVFLCPAEMSLDLPIGSTFSLFPMGRVSGISSGLKWPIDGLRFAPDLCIGTSNEVIGPVHIKMAAPKMLAIVPVSALDQIVDILSQTDARWPVHGR